MCAQDSFVCDNCFEDPGLIAFIRNNVCAQKCQFFSATGDVSIAASVADVSEHFIECLLREYSLAADELGLTDLKESLISQQWDAQDLALDELALEFPQDNMELLLPLLFSEYYDDGWCKRNPYGLDDSEWSRYSWERFCYSIMHKRRFFFLSQGQDSYDPEVYSPREVLSTIFDYAQNMGLFKELPAGHQLVRARFEGSGPPLETPRELGLPPAENAIQSNRMSPAGIPMFYACDDEETALRETASGPGRFATGRFETLRPITILDLTGIPPVPSLFQDIPDSAEVIPRRALTFLHHVAEEMSRPIERDDKVHINYIPTQVVTEFIRDQVTWGDTQIEGIRYDSSVHPGHVSYVLFAIDTHVEATTNTSIRNDPWLRLVEVNHAVHGRSGSRCQGWNGVLRWLRHRGKDADD